MTAIEPRCGLFHRLKVGSGDFRNYGRGSLEQLAQPSAVSVIVYRDLRRDRVGHQVDTAASTSGCNLRRHLLCGRACTTSAMSTSSPKSATGSRPASRARAAVASLRST